jgi:hypothetical protein
MQTKLITLFLLIATTIFGQDVKQNNYEYKSENNSRHHLAVQYMGLTYHPGGGAVKMVQYYPLKFDKKANFVLNIGAVVKYDYDLSDKWFLRSAVSYLKDCAYQDAGFAYVGINYKVMTRGRHSIQVGVGPVFTVREDWHKFDGYRDTDIYGKRVWKGMQYRLVPLGGEIEYKYKINENVDFLYSVIPGYPAVITSMFGFRWKL